MASRTNDEIYEKVVTIKSLLTSKQDTWVTKAHFDASIKGLAKPSPEKKEEPKKEEEKPSTFEQLAPLTGIGDIVVNIIKKNWIPAALAAIAALGIKFFNWDVLGEKLLGKLKLKLDPKKFIGITKNAPAAPAVQVPTNRIDLERLKNMRSAALALTRSLSDLHKEVQQVSTQIA
ncbi:hypothetical protein EOT10_09725 [Streptomyces antnestii]|uniref:Uncharacterized protein n=1 Tax=Streptomyces antnestii TaxID=2494256 RepID=A0A437PYV6_9ACTN|nr:hypothetical protein [Streptomyces sp. San01]RVU27432.1 hypothetical protein EOT10_09725 [Streptomyces sp. San01]